MYWMYPEHDEAYKYKNQYFFGSELIVVPITTPQDATVRLGKVKAWLPPGKYVDYFTGVTYEGNRELWINRPLRQYPVLLKQGAIIPLDVSHQPENGGSRPAGFELILTMGADGSFDLLEEPEGTVSPEESSAWTHTPIQFVQKTGLITIGPSSTMDEGLRSWSIRLMGARKPEKLQALVDGNEQKPEVSTEANGILIKIGNIPTKCTVSIALGSEPQSKRPEVLNLIEPVLLHSQNEYVVKDKVWAILNDRTKTLTAQLAGLQALDINPSLWLFLLEYMSAEVDGGI